MAKSQNKTSTKPAARATPPPARKARPPVAPGAKAAHAPTPPAARTTTRARDPRNPAPGTVLERVFKGKTHKVTVKEDGFEYAGKRYTSLTAAAKAATGYPSISGTLFWGIAKPATRKAAKG